MTNENLNTTSQDDLAINNLYALNSLGITADEFQNGVNEFNQEQERAEQIARENGFKGIMPKMKLIQEQEKNQAEQPSQDLSLTIQATESPSIKPSIEESERFIQFLNKKFNLGLRNDLIVLIHETSPNMKGYFRSVKCAKIWNESNEPSQDESKAKPLNSIVLSSHTLKETPYETLAHELAHYINFMNGIKDCSGNQYHNKHFKSQAEKLLLTVEKDKLRGFAYTTETEEFKKMLNEEFKPSKNAFKIFQNIQEKKQKGKSRLLLYMCDCGVKIRTAKNQDKPLTAICLYCNGQFKEVEK